MYISLSQGSSCFDVVCLCVLDLILDLCVSSPEGHHLGGAGVHDGAHAVQHVVEGNVVKLLREG